MVRVCDVGATDDGQHVRKVSLCSLLLSGMLRVHQGAYSPAAML